MASVQSQYDDTNRAFLQALMARGTLTLKEAQPILAAIFTARDGSNPITAAEDVTQQDFATYLSTASDAISPFDYEIRSAVHQVSKERVFAIVNTTSDPITQLATTYTHDEIAFVRRVLDTMFESYNSPRMEVLSMTEMQAIKLRRAPNQRQTQGGGADGETQQETQSTDKGLKTSEVERVLKSLVAGGWFERSKEGFYSLSPRSLMELRSWLVDSYNDPDASDDEWQRIKFCVACKDVVTVGQRCAERDCNVRLHDICQDAFWRSREKKCPKCAREWTGRNFVGERAVTQTEAFQRGKRRSGGARAPRSSNFADEIIEQQREEEEQDEDEDEDEE
jgi:non-structural maintenance of chromosomes element 1